MQNVPARLMLAGASLNSFMKILKQEVKIMPIGLPMQQGNALATVNNLKIEIVRLTKLVEPIDLAPHQMELAKAAKDLLNLIMEARRAVHNG